MSDFLMPSLGADMEAGTLVEWLVKPGQSVRRGDVVAVVETDKGAIEIEIFEDGQVEELLVQVGEKVPVGTAIARLAGPDKPETMPAPPKAERPPPVPPPAVLPHHVPLQPGGPRITPAARRRAEALGVDLATIKGTGVEGAISLADVEVATADKKPLPTRGAFDPQRMRKAIAAAMSRSKREIPHFYLQQAIDLSAALAWLAETNRDRPPERRLLPGVLLLKASARALLKAPQLNGYWQTDAFLAKEKINIAWAISLRGGGLVAPALADCASRSLDDLMTALSDLVTRARKGGLRSSEMSEGTVTITSLGDRGADSVLPVIFPPQVASIGFGRILERAWAADGVLSVRPVIVAALAADHRVSDGHMGSLFLDELSRLLQEPEKL